MVNACYEAMEKIQLRSIDDARKMFGLYKMYVLLKENKKKELWMGPTFKKNVVIVNDAAPWYPWPES